MINSLKAFRSTKASKQSLIPSGMKLITTGISDFTLYTLSKRVVFAVRKVLVVTKNILRGDFVLIPFLAMRRFCGRNMYDGRDAESVSNWYTIMRLLLNGTTVLVRYYS